MSVAGRCMAARTASGTLVGPGILRNSRPLATVMFCLPGPTVARGDGPGKGPRGFGGDVEIASERRYSQGPFPCQAGGPMRAWTVDADDIRVAEDFDESLLHRTPEIDSFLNLDRDDKFIVIGTKGFGKTLLLKAKRILHQRKTKALCLPLSNLLDKPIGDKV